MPKVRDRSEYNKAYYRANRERLAAHNKKYREDRKEEIKVKSRERYVKNFEYFAEYGRAYRERNAEKVAEYQRQYRIKNRDALHQTAPTSRPDRCEICGDTNRNRVLCFDHCHVFGNFRGWLCHRCNYTLGHVNDDPELLRKMAAYLDERDRL